jgi:surface polysaccharide O-acyltransferase-like enzyme
MNPAPQIRKRYAYLDFLRVLAVFLVIVNHTNSIVFRSLTPADPTWWFSVVWYYLSKIAVPLFIMVSGACLLTRQDGYRRAFGRFVRILLALVIFSYGYYLVNLWETYWIWQKALDIPAFLGSIWAHRITDSYWYLYFYLALMVMLPVLQRLASAMRKRDLEYFMGVSFTVFGIWPLVTHYVPALALPDFFDLAPFGVLIGLFFAGHYLNAYAQKCSVRLCSLIVVASLAVSTALTGLEYSRVDAGVNYLFMDSRTAPSIFVVLSAMAVMVIGRKWFEAREPLREKAASRLVELGGCTFGVYLLQGLMIVETRHRYFDLLRGVMNPLLAALVWEIGVFTVTFAFAWGMRRIPLLKKLL